MSCPASAGLRGRLQADATDTGAGQEGRKQRSLCVGPGSASFQERCPMRRMVLMIAIGAAAVPVNGQVASKKADAPREYKAPRTPDGHPDLQGYWTTQTFT